MLATFIFIVVVCVSMHAHEVAAYVCTCSTDTLTLTVDMDDAPEAIAFVLKRESPEEWYSGPTGDFWIAFKPADPNAIGSVIMEG